MSSYHVCPFTETIWKKEADHRDIGGLHDTQKFSSASKLGVDQYLAIKAIWKIYENNNDLVNDPWASHLGSTPDGIKAARHELQKEPAWEQYLQSVEKALPPNEAFPHGLGRFAMVLQNQKIVSRLRVVEPKHDQLKVIGSPMRTRSGPVGRAPEYPVSRLQSVIAETDHPRGEHPSPPRPQSRAGSKAPSECSWAETEMSNESYFDYTISKKEREEMADEQVINTAAISFLQSLFVHDLRNAYWSPQRKGFRFGQTDFKAYTDGHLQIAGEARSAALVEVKARKRPRPKDNDFRIEWQETAQMALWIREEPSSFWTTDKDRSKCRRLLISQDHEELYITIAEYEDSYLHYLQGRNSLEDSGFLTMNRFGPFRINRSLHMNFFGGIMKVLIPYAAKYAPQQKSPSPEPAPAERSASGERGRSPHTPSRVSELTTGRDGSPLARMTSNLENLEIHGHPKADSRSSYSSPSSGAQERSQLSSGQTAVQPAAQQSGQSIGLSSRPPAGQQSSQNPGPGRGGRARGGRGRGRGRGAS